MSALISKSLRTPPIRVVRGDGPRLYDEHGREYLDACGGVVVSSLGHHQPAIVAEMAKQAGRVAWAHAGTFATPVAEELAEELVSRSGGLTRAQFLSGGSEAIELALKIAYQYHWERGEPDRQVFIARRQNYHGMSLGALSITGNLKRRDVFEPMLAFAPFVAPCYAYRDRAEGETEVDYGARLTAELDRTIATIGSETVAAFVAETVVGSTSGAVPPVANYFAAVREVCDRHGILLILDEIMAGLGRTGRHFAYHDDGVLPDIVTVGKGLAAGFQPISAVLTGEPVYRALADGSGVLRNGQTYINHPVACATALAVQRYIDGHDLIVQARERGSLLRSGLEELQRDIPQIGDVRGRGLFLGVEIVADRQTKAPLSDRSNFAPRMKAVALQHGLLTYPGAGTIDGTRGHHVLFAPPFISTEADIEEMVARFAMAFTQVLATLKSNDVLLYNDEPNEMEEVKQ